MSTHLLLLYAPAYSGYYPARGWREGAPLTVGYSNPISAGTVTGAIGTTLDKLLLLVEDLALGELRIGLKNFAVLDPARPLLAQIDERNFLPHRLEFSFID